MNLCSLGEQCGMEPFERDVESWLGDSCVVGMCVWGGGVRGRKRGRGRKRERESEREGKGEKGRERDRDKGTHLPHTHARLSL